MAIGHIMEFNRDAFHSAMLEMLDKCMDDAIKDTFGEHPFFNSNGTEKFNNITGYEYQLFSSDLKAWLLEYGSGIYMDEERNPYIDEYKSSSLYNPYRKTNAIARRGSAEYEQLDYKKGFGTTTQTGTEPAGEELPDWLQKKFSTKPKPFIDDLLKQTFILFKTNAYIAISDMNKRLNEFIVTKEVKL